MDIKFLSGSTITSINHSSHKFPPCEVYNSPPNFLFSTSQAAVMKIPLQGSLQGFSSRWCNVIRTQGQNVVTLGKHGKTLTPTAFETALVLLEAV